jgi:hypothetical protein
MIPDRSQVIALALRIAGDPTGKAFDTGDQSAAFEMAYRRVRSAMVEAQVPRSEKVVTYTLPSGTTTLTPATAGITDMGEPGLLEERLSGSSDDYTEVEPRGVLPQFDAGSSLLYFEWREDAWQFIGATTDRQLRITYLESDAVPASGSVGLDGSLNLLATLTAAYMAPWQGSPELGEKLMRDALGENRDGHGGLMAEFISPMVRTMQRSHSVQPPAYDVRRNKYLFRRAYRPIQLNN